MKYFTRQEIKNKIDALIEKRYSGYRGKLFEPIGKQHAFIRNMMGDREFLRFLQRLEKENPKPIYPS